MQWGCWPVVMRGYSDGEVNTMLVELLVNPSSTTLAQDTPQNSWGNKSPNVIKRISALAAGRIPQRRRAVHSPQVFQAACVLRGNLLYCSGGPKLWPAQDLELLPTLREPSAMTVSVLSLPVYLSSWYAICAKEML